MAPLGDGLRDALEALYRRIGERAASTAGAHASGSPRIRPRKVGSEAGMGDLVVGSGATVWKSSARSRQ